MDSTANGNIPCDIANTPFIFGTAGLCGVGMNFKKAIQRFRKFTTIALQFTPDDATPAVFTSDAYTGEEDILSVGVGGSAVANGYPAAVLATMGKTQTNLSAKGRPCPIESAFIICAIEVIAEPLMIYDTASGNVPLGAQFLESYQAYIQHQVLRHLSLTYSYSEDSCEADFDPLRFYLSQYGKGFLNNASHNGVMVKNNVIKLPVLLPIVQGANENEANITKLKIAYDNDVNVMSGSYLPGFETTATPEIAVGERAALSATTRLLQEVTIVLDGFCMPRAQAMALCQTTQQGTPIPANPAQNVPG